MQVKETQNEGLKRSYQFTLPAADLAAQVETKLKEAQPEIEMKGFRKGKVPMAMLKKQFGPRVMGDAMQEAIDSALRDHMEKSGDRPALQPKVEMVGGESWKEGDDLVVDVTYEALPAIPEPDLSGVELERLVVEPSEEQVTEALENLAKNAQSFEDRKKGTKSKDGDQLVIDFKGSVDGELFEGGSAEDYPLVLGSNSFIPGFEDQIVGHSAGEEFDVNVTFPEEYQAAELAGKAAVFKIKLHEVKYKELPALDDELAKDCSEYDTLDEFKASIRKNNQEQLDKQDDLAVENALVDQVIDGMEAEIPQAMYDTRMDEMVNDFAFRVEQQGLRLEDYLKYMGQTMDQFRASFMPQAEKQVKIRLALEAVAAAENIEASEEDVSAEIKRIADQYKMEEDKVRELVNVDDLKKDLAINKAIDFIKSHANIVEKAAEEEKAADAE
jgi:trigger factor